MVWIVYCRVFLRYEAIREGILTLVPSVLVDRIFINRSNNSRIGPWYSISVGTSNRINSSVQPNNEYDYLLLSIICFLQPWTYDCVEWWHRLRKVYLCDTGGLVNYRTPGGVGIGAWKRCAERRRNEVHCIGKLELYVEYVYICMYGTVLVCPRLLTAFNFIKCPINSPRDTENTTCLFGSGRLEGCRSPGADKHA